MTNLKSEIRNLKSHRAFTVIELLIVITIIALIAGLALSGLVSAVNDARAARTRSQISKIDTLLMERYESYRTRSVRVPASNNTITAAQNRVSALRELMRFELPDRITDVTDGPSFLSITPSLTQSYRRLALRATNNTIANWTRQHQGSECLYLILATMKDGDKSALEFFTPDEIGDVDTDGMKEILDGFGQPIEFLRWAPGYAQQKGADGEWGVASTNDDADVAGLLDDIFEAGWPGSDDFSPLTLQTRIGIKHPDLAWESIEYAPDPFDPLRVDPRVSDALNTNDTYFLKPLIFSAGPDKAYDVAQILEDTSTSTDFRYSQSATYPPPPDGSARVANDPYFVPPAAWNQQQLGTIGDTNGDGTESWADNITNHFIEPQ